MKAEIKRVWQLNKSAQVDRREFVRGTFRYASLAALLGAAALAQSNRTTDRTCTRRDLCAGCNLLADCGLPPARTARQNLPGGKP